MFRQVKHAGGFGRGSIPGFFRKTLVLPLIFILHAAPLKAEDLDLAGEIFKDLKARFTLFVPLGFELFEPPRLPFKTDAPIALFLRPVDRNSKFPTFNVLEIAGTLQFTGKTEAELAANILKSYRLVGILSAAVVTSSFFEDENTKGQKFNAELSYSDKGQNLRSGVTVVPGYGRHYILTFVDLDQDFEGHRSTWQILSKSFAPIGHHATQTAQAEFESSSGSKVSPILIALGLIAALLTAALIIRLFARIRKI